MSAKKWNTKPFSPLHFANATFHSVQAPLTGFMIT